MLRLAVGAALLCAPPVLAFLPQDSPVTTRPTPPASLLAGYQNYEQFTTALRTLIAEAGPNARLESIARTASGREVWMLQLAAPGEVPPEQRRGILLVAGIAAEHPASSAIACRVAERLLRSAAADAQSPAADLLRRRVLYVIPRANPDGIEACFAPVLAENRLNARPIDDDRDGLLNEDAPNDLNGDGRITAMRVPDPQGEWMADPDEPRLLRKADPAKGERGIYRIMLEGLDDDADGQINEDPPGGVDLDRNWPHLFQPGDPAVGIHQLSEPETRGLADFVLAHPNIAAAIVYGRHDTVFSPPTGKDRDSTGRAFRDLHPDDHAIYGYISEKYKALGETFAVTGARPEGAFYSWLYSQQGLPTFALRFGRILPQAETKDAAESQPATQPGSQPAEPPAPDTPPAPGDALHPHGGQATPRPAGGRRGRGQRPGRSGESEAGPPQADSFADLASALVEASDVNKRWLKHLDEHPLPGAFTDWTDYHHPTLGDVQIGGFAPCFHTTPPAEELPAIAERQAAFIEQLSEWLPQPEFGPARVHSVGGGVWDVELRLRNPGYLPTHLAIARHIESPPFMVRPELPPERILGGPPVAAVENLPGGGQAVLLRWLVRGAADESVEFKAAQRRYGEFSTTVKLVENPLGRQTP